MEPVQKRPALRRVTRRSARYVALHPRSMQRALLETAQRLGLAAGSALHIGRVSFALRASAEGDGWCLCVPLARTAVAGAETTADDHPRARGEPAMGWQGRQGAMGVQKRATAGRQDYACALHSPCFRERGVCACSGPASRWNRAFLALAHYQRCSSIRARAVRSTFSPSLRAPPRLEACGAAQTAAPTGPS